MTTPSLLAIETATLSSWPSVTVVMDGSWVARMARGFTRRANSICCLDPADDGDAPARLRRLADLYALNSRDPVFRVTPLAGPGVLAALDADDWSSEGETRVLAMPLAADFSAPGNMKIYDATDDNWLDAVRDLAGLDRRSRDTLALIVGLIAWRQAGIVLRDASGEPVAAALAVAAGDIGVYHNVVVRADARGKGHGRAVMHAALSWTREAGATHAAIQVLVDNAPAASLYASLGFEEAYRYHYRQPR